MSLKNNPTLKLCKVRVGITIGDPSGIGPAITLKAVNKLQGLADFVVIGDSWVLSKLSAFSRQPSDKNIVDLNNVARNDFCFGKIRPEYGRASIEYLDRALDLIKSQEIDCLVTAPISKEAINKAGFKYSGHTEFLLARIKTKGLVMMLLNKRLKFSLVTRHIPLKSVPLQLSADKLNETIILTHESLKKLFSIKNPKIIVCGLNPHASDNGLIGTEEASIIKPAVDKLKQRIKNLSGPISADVAILKALQKEYDCVIAIYHDQALIPLKLTDKSSGVNITLGLPFVRTSPLHGTAFDIADKPALANPDSMIEAIKLAIQCTSNLKKA
jgi:4-hydroxythreonine-4-phosphate dehydrogenase